MSQQTLFHHATPKQPPDGGGNAAAACAIGVLAQRPYGQILAIHTACFKAGLADRTVPNRPSLTRALARPACSCGAWRTIRGYSMPIAPALRGAAAESARGVSPRAAHRSGLDTLASSGSCHRNEGCRLSPKIGAHPVVSWLTPDVGDLPPLLHGNYPASSLLRSSPPLAGASVLSASRFRPLAPFPLASSARFSSSVRKPE